MRRAIALTGLVLAALAPAAGAAPSLPGVHCRQAAHVAGFYQGAAQYAPIPARPPLESAYRTWAKVADRLCGRGRW